MNDKKNITGIILSGGKSSRMGEDKGLLNLNGKPFMSHVIEALVPFVDDIIIVSDHKRHDVFGVKRITDKLKNAGPLSGLYSGLAYSTTSLNIILSCDIPRIDASILSLMVNAKTEENDVVIVASKGKVMPLIGIYEKRCEKTIVKLLNNGERRLQTALKALNVKTILLAEHLADYTVNINTKEELNQLKNEIED